MPILVKLEPPDVAAVVEATSAAVVVPDKAFDETFEVAPAINETVTIATAAVESEKNPHESLMTEDNDDSSEEVPLAVVQKKLLPPFPALKLKKNEVFK